MVIFRKVKDFKEVVICQSSVRGNKDSSRCILSTLQKIIFSVKMLYYNNIINY
jgi:hypothetical protein